MNRNMAKNLYKSLTIFITALTLSSAALAEEITVVTANLSPFTISDKLENPGFLHEIVAEMKKRSGVNLKIKYLPWKRAQVTVQKEPNTLIFGLTRTKKREPNYSWLINLLNTDKVFVSTQKIYNSFAEAKQAKAVSVRKDTPQERQLKSEGFDNLFSVNSTKQNPELLKIGRVDAWMTLSHRAAHAWKKAGYEINDLKVGKSISQSQLYLAGNKALSERKDLKDKLQKAYDSVVADGTFNKLHIKYFGTAAK